MPGRLVRAQGGGWIRRAAGLAGALTGYTAKQVIRNYIRQPKAKAKENDGGNGTAVTGQTDHKLRYKARRKGRRGMMKARRARRFRNKVLSVLQRDQNPQWFRFKSYGAVSAAGNNQSVTFLGGLHTYCGTQTSGNGDISFIYDAMTPLVTQQGAGGLPENVQQKDNSKFTIKSAYMDLDIANQGTQAFVLDIYELIARKDVAWPAVASMFSTPDGYWKGIPANTSNELQNTIGCSLYQMDDITCNFKIVGKTTYQIAVGGVVSVSMSQNRRKTYYGADIGGEVDIMGQKGMTKIFVGIARGVPGATGPIGSHSYSYENRRQYNAALATNLWPDMATSTNISG